MKQFGSSKSELMKLWIVMDTKELTRQCLEYEIELKPEIEPSTSSQIMQKMFTHLTKFEAEALTYAQQQAGLNQKNQQNDNSQDQTSSLDGSDKGNTS